MCFALKLNGEIYKTCEEIDAEKFKPMTTSEEPMTSTRSSTEKPQGVTEISDALKNDSNLVEVADMLEVNLTPLGNDILVIEEGVKIGEF